MEGTRFDLIEMSFQPAGETHHREIWYFGQRAAAEYRLKRLSDIKDQPSRIDSEFRNIRGSVEWLIANHTSQTDELTLAYLEILESYMRLRGRDIELEKWCEAGLDACERLRRNPSRVLLILGNVQYALGQWKQAENSWQAAMIASEKENRHVYAWAVSALGRLQINQGRYKTALETLALAEELLKKINDIQSVIGIRSEVAAYYLNRRELDKALKLYLEIDDLAKNNGISESTNHTMLMLGVVYRQKGVFDKAGNYLIELCRSCETRRDMAGVATGSHHLAWVFYELGNLKQARHLCGKAMALYENLKDPRGLSDCYEQLGAIVMEEGRLEEAIDFIQKSINVRQQIGNDPGSVSSQRRLALAYMLKGDRGQAIRLSVFVLTRYWGLGIFSVQRALAFLKDFIIGMFQTLLLGRKRGEIKSVAEELSHALLDFDKSNRL